MRILIVDDDPEFCHSTGELLGQNRHEAVYAYSEEQAAQLLRTDGNRLDVALIDMFMKTSESGLNLIKVIAQEHLSVIPIVVTGYGDVQNAVKSMKAGAFDYVQKGIDCQGELILLAIGRALRFRTQLSRFARFAVEVRKIIGELEDVGMHLQRLADEMRIPSEADDGSQTEQT